MNGIVKILSPLLLASFLFSHCELFSIASGYLAKQKNPQEGVCINPDCCCDHEGPEGNLAVCGMCTTQGANPNIFKNDQCCLYQANCDPASGQPVLSVNKDLQSVKSAVGKFNFANAVYFRPLENGIQIFDFKPAVFHPPQV